MKFPKLFEMFLAEAAGIITKEPIKSAPTKRMPKATTRAKIIKNMNSRRLFFIPIDCANSEETMLRASFFRIDKIEAIKIADRIIEANDS